jgi:hypothetical protein
VLDRCWFHDGLAVLCLLGRLESNYSGVGDGDSDLGPILGERDLFIRSLGLGWLGVLNTFACN